MGWGVGGGGWIRQKLLSSFYSAIIYTLCHKYSLAGVYQPTSRLLSENFWPFLQATDPRREELVSSWMLTSHQQHRVTSGQNSERERVVGGERQTDRQEIRKGKMRDDRKRGII